MTTIDAHCHIWTPDTERFPLAPGHRRANMEPASFTVEELMKQMQGVNVDKVVLIQMSFYGYDNSYMLKAIADHPDKFRGVAVIEQDEGDPTELMKQLKKQGCSGFRIYPKDRQFKTWLSSDTMHTMWKVGAAEHLNMCCLMDTNGLPALDQMCRMYPQTPVVIDHMCRIGVTGEIVESELQALCDMARHRNVTVKVSAFYALGKKSPPYTDLGPMIEKLLTAFGPERLMWASDGPYQMQPPHSYKASVELIRDGLSFLKPTDKEWLLAKTAERVFYS
ncbi:amidohydrolase family protein [bacterium]|nr:amidohydrolase family protein [bacterium]